MNTHCKFIQLIRAYFDPRICHVKCILFSRCGRKVVQFVMVAFPASCFPIDSLKSVILLLIELVISFLS